MKHLLILASLFFLSSGLSAQDKKIPKLVVEKGQTYVVGPENMLFVDTLILEDKATIQFAPERQGVLETNVVIVGKNCLITSRGTNGNPGKNNEPGTDGENGGDLSLVLRLKELKSLTIDTRGGNGGKGMNGSNGQQGTPEQYVTRVVKDPNGKTVTITDLIPGQPGTDGGNATMGGGGGNGGNVMLLYSTDGFIPIFNHGRHKNNITILHTAGTQGKSGEPGKGGNQRIDGIVEYSNVKPASDGELMLVNLDQRSQALLPEVVPVRY